LVGWLPADECSMNLNAAADRLHQNVVGYCLAMETAGLPCVSQECIFCLFASKTPRSHKQGKNLNSKNIFTVGIPPSGSNVGGGGLRSWTRGSVHCLICCHMELGVFVRIRNNFIRITDNFGIIRIIIRIIRIINNFS
jgi:hypothetical protein